MGQNKPMHPGMLLDHTIVGGTALTNFTFRKDRPWAGCQICGEVFQPKFNMEADEYAFHADLNKKLAAEDEITDWREKHNKTHTAKEHIDLRRSGMTFTPEAARRMAPLGVVPVVDALQYEEIAQAMKEAPRAPLTEIETSLKGHVRVPNGLGGM